MREPVHQLHLVQHVLAVRGQQVHLEDHHLGRRAVRHLRQRPQRTKFAINVSFFSIFICVVSEGIPSIITSRDTD